MSGVGPSGADVLRVGNCSGFYGDRLSAMREMLEGGDLDVLTGDYLAELTMLILGRDRLRDASLGYARTFVRQMEECLGLALDRGVRIVTDAGGLNPAGLAARLAEVADAQGLLPRIAWVDGDDVADRVAELGLADPGDVLTANAYLGGFGIAAALARGADVVVTGRVTDASLAVGPAVAHFGWTPEDHDQLAGAVVAGHVLECGAQATGGNYSGFLSLLEQDRAGRPVGFPVVEIHRDGSSVVTKHADTGGLVSVDTVTAQLVYEIQSEAYLGPDVTTHLDSVRLSLDAPDRVRVSEVRGSAPPAALKVCLNSLGGYRNQLELVLTGLAVEEKATWVQRQAEQAWEAAGCRPRTVDWSLVRTDQADAPTQEAASARLRVTVRDPSAEMVGTAFTAPLVELALASYPGFTLTSAPAAGTPYGVYRPGYVARSAVAHTVHHHDGEVEVIAGGEPAGGDRVAAAAGADEAAGVPGAPSHLLRSFVAPVVPAAPSSGVPATATCRVPLGLLAHARSGDKGGDANLGLWVSQTDPRAAARTAWLLRTVTPAWVRALLPETAGLDVAVFGLPNLNAVNVVIHGLLGQGVAASSRFDPQAKGLGEWARSRHVEIPEELV